MRGKQYFTMYLLVVASTLFAKPQYTLPSNASEKSLVAVVESHIGLFDDTVKSSFYRHCEKEVMKQLSSVGVILTAPQLAFIKEDQEIYEACFATVYPVDARILLNVLELREQLGNALFFKYKGLCIAGAVVRRNAGLGCGTMGEKEEWCIKCPVNPASYLWRKYSVVDISDKYISQNLGNLKPKTSAKSSKRLTKKQLKKRIEYKKKVDMYGVSPAGIEKYMKFLRDRDLTPSATYTDPELAKQAIVAMGSDAPKAKRFNMDFYFKIMATQGLRPAERDPFPSMADYIRFLDNLPTHLFPITSAPWPILFPLAKGWPLREARDIIKRHATSKKLITYGNYHGKSIVYEKRLLPFAWHYNSWQGKVQAGGVCHEMSTIGVGTYQSFGIPSCKAGRPNHSYVMYFSKDNEGYACHSKQGVARGGHSQWGFADPLVECPFVYHQGLALAMNVGLDEYMDTRVAVNLSKILVNNNRGDLAKSLLRSAAKRNPFNTELWVALKFNNLKLSEDSTLYRAELFNYMNRIIKLSPSMEISTVTHDDSNEDSSREKSRVVSAYLRDLTAMFDEIKPARSLQVNRSILEFIAPLKGSSVTNIDRSITRLKIAVYGWERLSKEIILAAQKGVLLGKKSAMDAGLVRDFEITMAYAEKADDRNKYMSWLKQLGDIVCQKSLYKPKRKKQYLDPLYKRVIPVLITELIKANRNDEAKVYQKHFEMAQAKETIKKKKK